MRDPGSVRDVLGYAGKRVIVTGAAGAIGNATARILVDLGVEVHAIDATKPDVTGLASYTECDLRDPQQVDAAVARIGRIVNALFACVPEGMPRVAEALVADFLPGSAIASVVPLSIAAPGVRINCIVPELSVAVDDVAWALVLCNSPRAAAISGLRLAARRGSVQG